MTEPLEALYPRIGQSVADLIDANWEEANIRVSIKPGVIQLKSSYTITDTKEVVSFAPNRSLVRLFRELHERMVTELEDNWQTALFNLKPDGKFEIQFGY
mgnify:CR=1 FL=1